MAEKILGKVTLLAFAMSMFIATGFTATPVYAQSAASNALAISCSGNTRDVFPTTSSYISFMVSKARQLTGRTFEQDLISCAENLPNLGNEGFTALQALHGVCLELRASPATCTFVRRQQNLYVTVSGG